MWHVALVSRARPNHTLPAFLNLHGSKKRDEDEKEENESSDQDRKYFRGPDGRYVCEQPGCNFETLSSLGFKIISHVFIFFSR